MKRSTMCLALGVSAIAGVLLGVLQAKPNNISQPEMVWEQPEAEPIGNNIWVTHDHVRGVACYRSAQSGGSLSCVALPRDK